MDSTVIVCSRVYKAKKQMEFKVAFDALYVGDIEVNMGRINFALKSSKGMTDEKMEKMKHVDRLRWYISKNTNIHQANQLWRKYSDSDDNETPTKNQPKKMCVEELAKKWISLMKDSSEGRD